ncbi:MAG TPA: glutamine synthetase family protein [Acidobacteriaceae bacterium]|nr:glutamine synthetase family protein [Terriglobia bacterium]HVC90327.1 glutamine synthetase family protein [Acidobacteriaceae bacterium]
MSSELRDFLALSYGELEDLNLEAKEQRRNRVAAHKIQEQRIKYLTDEKRIKAVTVLFSDLEGRLHMLDYDKKFLVKSWDNLTFDGSSIRGFTAQRESDLRLGIDWSAFYWAPADVFGNGKVLVFGEVIDKEGGPYSGDLRSVLKQYSDGQYKSNGYTLNAANEIEGFLFAGVDAERRYHETGKFEYVNTGGYYHSLPGDPLRKFIDTVAEVQRSMGFENEKDHPEVAPSQFEINYGYGEVVAAADQIQLYKLICRQVATNLGYTASFLPKPVVGVNGSGMHTNVSVSKDSTNLFWDPKGEEKLSKFGWTFLDRILTHGLDLCLTFNSSVNAYRRLDPHYEAPNQLRASAVDRGAMVRVPIGNHRSMRIEVRAVAPDANPYLVLYSIFKTGLDGEISKIDNLRQAERYLPDNIYTAIEDFRDAAWTTTLLGADVKGRYADLKQAAADRCARLLGTIVKAPEVQYHHDVYNQYLWNMF